MAEYTDENVLLNQTRMGAFRNRDQAGLRIVEAVACAGFANLEYLHDAIMNDKRLP
jgi:hypothetical protein